MNKDLDFYENLFKKSGYKFTKQKKKILLEIINSDKHVSVKEIYDKVKKDKVGFATIYRSLKLFSKLGIIKEITINNISYFEMKIFSKKPLHIHFKCSNCDSIIDIDNKNLNLQYIKLNKIVEEEYNLEIRDLDIMLIGLCSKCKEENKWQDQPNLEE